jgi:hypothetical protein
MLLFAFFTGSLAVMHAHLTMVPPHPTPSPSPRRGRPVVGTRDHRPM